MQVEVPQRQLSLDPAPAIAGADEEYHYSPDIKFIGNDTYKEKVQSGLEELKKTDIIEYDEVMLYLDMVREKGG